MSIKTPIAGILNFKTIPVDCWSCEYYGNLSDISDDDKKTLIKATTSHHLVEERKMLMKLQELFSRHPNSKHEIILRYTSRSALFGGNIAPEPDPEFENDLDNNSDIAEFIGNSLFDLEGRLDFTKGEDKRLRTFQDRTEISCPECGACLVVPDVFYSMVGSYEDDIVRERSRKQGRALRRKLHKQVICGQMN